MLPTDKSLLDHLPGCIGWKDVNCRYQGANKGLLEFRSLAHVEDLLLKTDYELMPHNVIDNELFHLQDLRVLNGEKICVLHRDATTNTVHLIEKNPILTEDHMITGLIYYCRPWQKEEQFHKLFQLDHKLDLNIKDYSLDYHQNKFKLTERECECLFLLIRGKTAKEIATLLTLSSRTIESYLENIKNKMNCRNKSEVLVKAIANGYQNQIPSRLIGSRGLQAL